MAEIEKDEGLSFEEEVVSKAQALKIEADAVAQAAAAIGAKAEELIAAATNRDESTAGNVVSDTPAGRDPRNGE